MSDVILSIVIPIFEKKELVSEMISSILENDFQDWELLAVDDGSLDDTLAFLQHYADEDSRIKLITRNRLPKGAPTCRNIGLEHARGNYIIFFDSDDYITPTCLKQRVKAMEARPDLDFLVFPSGQMRNKSFDSQTPERAFGYRIFDDDLSAFIRKTLPFIVCNNIYRTKALREKGIMWDTNLQSLQDSDFNIRCILADLRYDYAAALPDYGYRIENNDGSISKNITSEKHFNSHIYALNKIYDIVQRRFGHRYDHDLYRGVLYIYNMIFSKTFDAQRALAMADVVRKHSRLYGHIITFQVALTRLFTHLLPQSKARTLPMALYLVWLRSEQRCIQKKRLKYISTRASVNS